MSSLFRQLKIQTGIFHIRGQNYESIKLNLRVILRALSKKSLVWPGKTILMALLLCRRAGSSKNKSEVQKEIPNRLMGLVKRNARFGIIWRDARFDQMIPKRAFRF